MESLLSEPSNVWLLGGVLLALVEAFTAPGLGLFLAGLGAICTGILIKAGIVNETVIAIQFAWFFGLTTVWAMTLWSPLQKFRMKAKHKNPIQLNNMVGEVAIVGKEGLKSGRSGQVTWSGTLMNAELDTSAGAVSLAEGAQVTIKSVSGTTLNVIPK